MGSYDEIVEHIRERRAQRRGFFDTAYWTQVSYAICLGKATNCLVPIWRVLRGTATKCLVLIWRTMLRNILY